jgi:hypothetical protein
VTFATKIRLKAFLMSIIRNLSCGHHPLYGGEWDREEKDVTVNTNYTLLKRTRKKELTLM